MPLFRPANRTGPAGAGVPTALAGVAVAVGVAVAAALGDGAVVCADVEDAGLCRPHPANASSTRSGSDQRIFSLMTSPPEML
jgi:hypothetical protein